MNIPPYIAKKHEIMYLQRHLFMKQMSKCQCLIMTSVWQLWWKDDVADTSFRN